MTLWSWERLYDLPCVAEEKRSAASFALLPCQDYLKWVRCQSSHKRKSVSLHWPLQQWLLSVWQYPFILFPATPCLSVLVFSYKCSWHFVYLSFKHSAKIMSENERKKKKETSIFYLLNLLQGKQFTILKTLRTFQDTQKSPVNCWEKSKP